MICGGLRTSSVPLRLGRRQGVFHGKLGIGIAIGERELVVIHHFNLHLLLGRGGFASRVEAVQAPQTLGSWLVLVLAALGALLKQNRGKVGQFRPEMEEEASSHFPQRQGLVTEVVLGFVDVVLMVLNEQNQNVPHEVGWQELNGAVPATVHAGREQVQRNERVLVHDGVQDQNLDHVPDVLLVEVKFAHGGSKGVLGVLSWQVLTVYGHSNVPERLGVRTRDCGEASMERAAECQALGFLPVRPHRSPLIKPVQGEAEADHPPGLSVVHERRGPEGESDVVLGVRPECGNVQYEASAEDVVVFVLARFHVKNGQVQFGVPVHEREDGTSSSRRGPHGRPVPSNDVGSKRRISAHRVHANVGLLPRQTDAAQHLHPHRTDAAVVVRRTPHPFGRIRDRIPKSQLGRWLQVALQELILPGRGKTVGVNVFFSHVHGLPTKGMEGLDAEFAFAAPTAVVDAVPRPLPGMVIVPGVGIETPVVAGLAQHMTRLRRRCVREHRVGLHRTQIKGHIPRGCHFLSIAVRVAVDAVAIEGLVTVAVGVVMVVAGALALAADLVEKAQILQRTGVGTAGGGGCGLLLPQSRVVRRPALATASKDSHHHPVLPGLEEARVGIVLAQLLWVTMSRPSVLGAPRGPRRRGTTAIVGVVREVVVLIVIVVVAVQRRVVCLVVTAHIAAAVQTAVGRREATGTVLPAAPPKTSSASSTAAGRAAPVRLCHLHRSVRDAAKGKMADLGC